MAEGKSEARAWQVATVLALVLAWLLWRATGRLSPQEIWERLAPDIPGLYQPSPPAETSDYPFLPPSVNDPTGGVTMGCETCGPQMRVSFFGTPEAQAEWMRRVMEY